jgi:hypothetical protein
MTRTIRPIGPVTAALKRHGYRQQAAIFVDGKQVPNTLVLSLKDGDRIKFEGHYIDANGELHKTKPMFDMKRAATRLMTLREFVLGEQEAAKPAVEPTTKRKPAAQRRHSSKPTPQSAGAMIECKGCGTRHADDTLCPE